MMILIKRKENGYETLWILSTDKNEVYVELMGKRLRKTHNEKNICEGTWEKWLGFCFDFLRVNAWVCQFSERSSESYTPPDAYLLPQGRVTFNHLIVLQKLIYRTKQWERGIFHPHIHSTNSTNGQVSHMTTGAQSYHLLSTSFPGLKQDTGLEAEMVAD